MYCQATVRSRTKDQAVLRWLTCKWIKATVPSPPEVSSNILNQSEWYNWHGMDTNPAFATQEFLATRARQKGGPPYVLAFIDV